MNPFNDMQSPTDNFIWNPFLTTAWQIDIFKMSTCLGLEDRCRDNSDSHPPSCYTFNKRGN